jgi:hypothetical protein
MQDFVSHACSVVFFCVDNDGGVKFLTFTYTEEKSGIPNTTWRFPTETKDKNNPEETPLGTVSGCVYQEVARDPHNFTFKLFNDGRPFHKEFVPNQDDRTKFHAKFAYLAEIESGELRQKPKEDIDIVVGKQSNAGLQSGQNIKRETLGPPVWYEAIELFCAMGQRCVPFHKKLLIKALETLAIFNPKVSDVYQNFLKNNEIK